MVKRISLVKLIGIVLAIVATIAVIANAVKPSETKLASVQGNMNNQSAGSSTDAYQVGSSTYASLNEAFNAASSGSTITVLKDVTEEDDARLNKSVTLNMNGKTITFGMFEDSSTALYVSSSGNLTVNGGGKIYANAYGNETAIINSGSLTVNGTTISGSGDAIHNTGTITINSGTVEAEGGIGIVNSGSLTIGSINDVLSTSNPAIIGHGSFGINNSGTFIFLNGKIEGVGSMYNTEPTGKRDDCKLKTGTEGNLRMVYYVQQTSVTTHTLNLEVNDSDAGKIVDQQDNEGYDSIKSYDGGWWKIEGSQISFGWSTGTSSEEYELWAEPNAGYEFTGWSCSTGEASSGTIKSDITFTANFARKAGTDVKVTGISLDRTSLTINEGETSQLNVSIYPSNASNKSVNWSSSDSSVASVSSDGVVTGEKEGTATITVTAQDGSDKSATCQVTVNKTNKNKYTVFFRPSDSKMGTVSQSSVSDVPEGSVITGTEGSDTVSVNGVDVTATANEGYKFVEWVVGSDGSENSGSENSASALAKEMTETGDVIAGPTQFSVNVSGDITMVAVFESNQKYTAYMRANDSSMGAVSQSSVTDLPYGASYSSNGATLTVNGTDVTATAKEGYRCAGWTTESQYNARTSASIAGLKMRVEELSAGISTYSTSGTISEDTTFIAVFEKDPNVVVKATSISLDKTTITINKGETTKLTATILPENTSNKSVTWNVSDGSIISIDEDGVIKGLSEGTTTVTVTTNDGSNKSATCTVNVKPENTVKDLTFDITYPKDNDGNVVVTIKTNNKVVNLDGWNETQNSDGSYTYTKTYSPNAQDESLTIRDEYGHEKTITISPSSNRGDSGDSENNTNNNSSANNNNNSNTNNNSSNTNNTNNNSSNTNNSGNNSNTSNNGNTNRNNNSNTNNNGNTNNSRNNESTNSNSNGSSNNSSNNGSSRSNNSSNYGNNGNSRGTTSNNTLSTTSKSDNSTSSSALPKTGVDYLIFSVIAILAVIAGLSFVKYRKAKNVK